MQLLALGIPIQGGQADECPNEGNYVGYRMDACFPPPWTLFYVGPPEA
jgi:hypothetical protein